MALDKSKFAQQDKPEAVRQSHKNNPHCWRSFVISLIHGAATNPKAYAYEIRRRNQGADMAQAEANGEAMGRKLREMFPDIRGIIKLARAATGEDEPDRRQSRQIFTVTVARCQAWLPPYPDAQGEANAARTAPRTGLDEKSRQRLAEATAEEWVR
jgi:hypothetical protein